MKDSVKMAVREFVNAPEMLQKIAGAVCYDLLHGPTYVVAPDGDWSKWTPDHHATFSGDLEEYGRPVSTYTSELANHLRSYIRDMPGTLYVDIDAECVTDQEPEGETDEETGEWYEPQPYYKLETSDIVEAVFGKTIAREFDW